MGTGLASVRQLDGIERAERAIRGFEARWRRGEPNLESYWAEVDCEKSMSVLAALVKVDLRCRYDRGERPTVADYIERHPDLCDHSDRVISLVYEEFCLCEEQGDDPDPERFCERYAPWRESLASQLGHHKDFSQVVGTPPPQPRFPVVGERFEQFQLRSIMGQGGSARVFRASDDSMGGREVVLKVSADRGNEPSIMGKLDHMHIVPVLRVAMQPERGLRGLSMPFRPGLPLDLIIKRVNPASSPRDALAIWNALVPEGSAESRPSTSQSGWQTFPIHGTYEEGVAWIVATLAKALAYSHEKGILHRDVKPANVLLTLGNGPQLLDFNLAHDPHSADQARAALRGGTLPYMAPEQLEAYLDPDRWDAVGAAAELYSLGLLMHELLTGRPPELPDQKLPPARAIRELLDRRAEPRVLPRHLNPAVPYALEGIVARCLMFAPEDRHPDARALADDLHRFLERRPLRYASNASARERFQNWIRRSWRRLASSATLSIILGVLLLPHAKGLIPIVYRPSFQRAVNSVELKEWAKAMDELQPLVEQYPDSALALLYLGLAKEGAQSDNEAEKKYAEALGQSDAKAEISAWYPHHPLIARQLIDAGKFLHPRKKRDLANRAWQIAVHLNPLLEEAQCLIAWDLATYLKRYAPAYETLTRIIEAAEARRSSADRNSLIAWYELRAKISLLWGSQVRSPNLPEASEAIKRHYQHALEDLRKGSRRITDYVHDQAMMREPYLVLEARVKKAQGDLATSLGQLPAAKALSLEALQLIERLSPARKSELEIVTLRNEIMNQLKAPAARE